MISVLLIVRYVFTVYSLWLETLKNIAIFLFFFCFFFSYEGLCFLCVSYSDSMDDDMQHSIILSSFYTYFMTSVILHCFLHHGSLLYLFSSILIFLSFLLDMFLQQSTIGNTESYSNIGFLRIFRHDSLEDDIQLSTYFFGNFQVILFPVALSTQAI